MTWAIAAFAMLFVPALPQELGYGHVGNVFAVEARLPLMWQQISPEKAEAFLGLPHGSMFASCGHGPLASFSEERDYWLWPGQVLVLTFAGDIVNGLRLSDGCPPRIHPSNIPFQKKTKP
jgi:hypothetical protein